MKRIFLLGIIILILTGCSNKEIKEEQQITENNGMLSYTIDGEKTDIKPTKEEGYIVNKIICNNGSNMMWDNDNWEVEFTKVNSKDRCKVDFTKDVNKEGYRITVTTNLSGALDSLTKATTENGTVKIYSKAVIKNVRGCNAIIEDNKVIVSNVKSNQTCNIEVEDKTLAGILKIAYPPQSGRTDFSVIDNGTPALYTGVDDQGTMYYFSGDGSQMNNWVIFADKWWRIIRINGNGSVRLLYAGDGNSANDVGTSTFNNSYNHPSYVGWKYTKGGSLSKDRKNENNSTVYSKLENWYNKNIVNAGFADYIDVETIYCNDRNIGSGSYDIYRTFHYVSHTRLTNKGKPIFTCSNESDRFNTFGLMTADEVVAAGGLYGENSPKTYYYLEKNGSSSITGTEWWWTMSPYRWDSTYSYVFRVNGSKNEGSLGDYEVNQSGTVRPVISLKPNTLVSGTGTATDPYVVQGLQ